jgi:hypothetical protein
MQGKKRLIVVGSVVITCVFVVGIILEMTRNLLAQTPALTSAPRPRLIYDVVTPLSPGGRGGVAMSPDGNLVVYAGAGGLRIQNLQTGNNRLLLGQVDEVGNLDVLTSPAFSPDGEHVVFAASGPTWYYPADIYSIGSDGSNLTKLTTSTLSGTSGHISEQFDHPLYSPDGTEIALAVYDVGSGEGYVGLVQSGTGEPSRLAEGQPLFWSTDGTGIFYSNSEGAIELLKVRTKQSQRVLNPLSIVGTPFGTAAAFVKTTSSISMVSLPGGTTAPANLVAALGGVSLNDGQGRRLVSVQSVGASHLLLVYSDILTGEHVEVLEY